MIRAAVVGGIDAQHATLFDAVRRLAGDRTIRKHHYVTLDVARKVDP